MVYYCETKCFSKVTLNTVYLHYTLKINLLMSYIWFYVFVQFVIKDPALCAFNSEKVLFKNSKDVMSIIIICMGELKRILMVLFYRGDWRIWILEFEFFHLNFYDVIRTEIVNTSRVISSYCHQFVNSLELATEIKFPL